MPAYMVCTIAVSDSEAYNAYTKVTPAIVARYGGRFIVRGGSKETLEGPEFVDRLVVVEFPSMDVAREFYSSPEYAQARQLREGCSTARFVLAEGLAGQAP